MHIIVNHLTRMQPGYICVAGINIANYQHIRPIANRRLTTDLLTSNGGPFDIASLLDLGYVRYCGSIPEIEDHSFNLRELRSQGSVSQEQFWKLLQKVAQRTLADIFGPTLTAHKNTCVLDVKTGKASLGCLIPTESPKLFIDSYGRLRARVTDGNFNVTPPVTDIRLYEADYKTPNQDAIQHMNERLQSNVPVVVSVGLSRPWGQIGDAVEHHWLQVNNIHFKELFVVEDPLPLVL